MPHASSTEARIGPNAVTQLGAALAAHGAGSLAREIYLAAGHPDWLSAPPAEMVPEAGVVALHDALRRLLPEDEARAYAREAGMRTGDYILAHRIPKAARMVLRLMPAPIAARLLVDAIAQHAWTFAGSGRFEAEEGTPVVLAIAANPLARTPGCDWHAAVFRRLFQSLVHESAEVRETACCAAGAPSCRFEISWRQDLRRPAAAPPALV
jgi:divinyl protochlorophyllide a 8-vinyl-reductase